MTGGFMAGKGRVTGREDVRAWGHGKLGRRLTPTAHEIAEATPGAVPNVQYSPPDIVPPPQSRYFFGRQAALGVVGPATVTFATTGTVQLPQNAVGVIRSFTTFVNDLLVSSDISFVLRFNDAPVPGHNDLFIFPRIASNAATFFAPEDTVIRAPQGAKIDFQVIVRDAGTYDLGIDYRGWFMASGVPQRFGMNWVPG